MIRRYRSSDYDAISRICLLTAAGGGDATGQHVSDDLMPDIFARPYVTLEPNWAWVVDLGDGAEGYILCAPDTRRFVERYRNEWMPALAATYEHVEPPVTHDEVIRHLGFTPERMLIPEVDTYPAHLHIDLLPSLQGRGYGRRLIETLADALRAAGIPGLHLSMDPANTPARAFYDRLGFEELPSSTPGGPVLGMRL